MVPRPSRAGLLAALLGVVALVPSVVLIGFVVLGMTLPRLMTHPFLVLGGLGVALMINVGASVRWRAEARADGITMECDLRLRYRGLNRAVIFAGGAIAAVLLMYLIAVNFGPR